MRRRTSYIIIVVWLTLICLSGCTTMIMCAERSPRGARLEKVRQSPQWNGRKFQNPHFTAIVTNGRGHWLDTMNLCQGTDKHKKPKSDVPSAKTSLKGLSQTDDVVVWLGHSSLFIQVAGKRFLFDPVLTNKLPVKPFMRPFPGADVYSPHDIPQVDYLIITHNHWDHLDYYTVKALEDSVGAVYCSLGIGESFAYWGYPEEKIHDMDWNDSVVLDNGIVLYCLPARHFSRRFLDAGKTLWASYLIVTPNRKVFVSGDGGYDTHFKAIGERFPAIDLAIMENGQYDKHWEFLHTLPSELPQAIDDLGARKVITYHNSKFALASHPWTEPMELIYRHSRGKPWILLTPRIGERFFLDKQQGFLPWWR